MPSGEAVQRSLGGAWRLLLGKPDGLGRLDLSADGFWDSFYAIWLSVPPLMVSWAVNVLDEPGLRHRVRLVLGLALIDLAAWVAPLAVLAAIARPFGIGNRFAPLVIALNWSAPILYWLMTPPLLLQLAVPRATDAALALLLLLMIASLVLSWRLTHAVLGKGAGTTTAVFFLLLVSSELVVLLLQALLGLPPIEGFG